MTPGPVASIQAGSIAEKAGFKKGDRIVKVDGRDVDPMDLADDLYARANQPTAFVVERTADGKAQPVELTATPDDSTPDVEPPLSPTGPMKLPGLGLAMAVEPKVAAVAEGSPAAKAGIAAGAGPDGDDDPPAQGGATSPASSPSSSRPTRRRTWSRSAGRMSSPTCSRCRAARST